MKHLLLATLCVAGVSASVSAQSTPAAPLAVKHGIINAPQLAPEARVAVRSPLTAADGFSDRPAAPLSEGDVGTVTHYETRELVVEQAVIGMTQYDLQSNASVDNRIAGSGDGVATAWTMSLEVTPFSDRGTGYNYFSGDTWEELPYNRIESVRTGWASLVHTADGREVVVNHQGIDTPLRMTYRDAAGSGAWSEMDIPSDIEIGKLWPRMAVGGEDGNSLHVVCISTPEGNGGSLLGGQNGAMLYYRSLDGGTNWDVTDMMFPALDSSQFLAFSGDAYAIHARGNTVAFAAFNDFADTFVMISNDNGDTWERTNIIDFPLDLYVIDDGLGDEDGEDWNNDGLFQEYFNSDGAGAVMVDASDEVHVTFGAMYYMDDDTTDGGAYSWFPGVNGIQYWSETMGADTSSTIAYAYDIDGSETLDLEDDIALYYVSLAGFPSLASDEDGTLYMSYSAVMENFSTGIQNYRHVYMVYSEDGGVTWNTDSACDLTPDQDFDGFECVFAALAPEVVNGQIELIYQRDFEPGLHIRGDLDPIDINDIIHLRLAAAGLSDCEDVETEEWVGIADPFEVGDVTLYPNPAADYVELLIDRPGSHEVRILSLTGQQVQLFQTTSAIQYVDVSMLSAGLYLVEVRQGTQRMTVRLAVD